jgi:hypothetical protein
MASSSSTMMTINLMHVSEKLVRENHTLWKAQILTVLHGSQLAGFLHGTNKAPALKLKIKSQKEGSEDVEEIDNPTYDLWKAQEQQVLSYLLTSFLAMFLSRLWLYQL